MRRVVIDTNVLVSHLLGGKPRQVVSLWYVGLIELCLSEDILAEYARVLDRFDQVENEARELLGLLTEGSNVRMVKPKERFRAVAADPSDNIFLECAVAAQADAIISGDAHLLDLGRFRGIPIMSPGAFLDSIMGD